MNVKPVKREQKGEGSNEAEATSMECGLNYHLSYKLCIWVCRWYNVLISLCMYSVPLIIESLDFRGSWVVGFDAFESGFRSCRHSFNFQR